MIIEHLLVQAARQPDAVAVYDETGSHTYARLASLAGLMAGQLGILSDKETIGLLLPSGAGYVVSFFGTLWAGKSVTPINFLMSEREIAHVVADSGMDMVITVTPLAERIKGLGVKVLDLLTLTPPTVVPAPPVPVKGPDDVAVLMYTSGTAGMPKGVELTYGNLQSDVDASIKHTSLTNEHRFLGMIPLFHSFGIMALLVAPIQLGTFVVYMSRFSAAGAVKAIREHNITLVMAVPSMYAAILHLKSATAEDFANVYALLSGGEPLPMLVAEGFRQRFNCPIYEGFGLTETSPVVSLNTPQEHRTGSVGRPIPGAKIRIVNEDGIEQPVGEAGEVWISGPMVMKRYHNLPRETAAALTSDGYFKTGDLGRVDADGFLYIIGRIKELIIITGEKVVPREIEDALLAHPAVVGAAVVGKKDPGRGEVIVAFVVLRPGENAGADELRQTCRNAGLPQWKIPREIIFETELPHSPTGKVLKRVLAQRVNAGM
jgi:long-chain acyl-CoA synthetase